MITGQGQMETTPAGANRESNKGRGRFDLLPYEALEAWAIWSEDGAEKYGPRNWENGLLVSDCINRLVRHAIKAANGWTDEDHLAACMWNAGAAKTMMKRRPDLNDHRWREETQIIKDSFKDADEIHEYPNKPICFNGHLDAGQMKDMTLSEFVDGCLGLEIQKELEHSKEEIIFSSEQNEEFLVQTAERITMEKILKMFVKISLLDAPDRELLRSGIEKKHVDSLTAVEEFLRISSQFPSNSKR